ncbi:hypothetical protein NMY22_g16220 [Coprinellus aureogranulatus]|nr:hypothetical protein NMY22_g16220 [Coprinellus aureogranulatus]
MSSGSASSSKKRSNSSASSTDRRVKAKATLSSILPTSRPKAKATVTTIRKGRNRLTQIQLPESRTPTPGPSNDGEGLSGHQHAEDKLNGDPVTMAVGEESENAGDWEDVPGPTKGEEKAQRRFAKAASKLREWLPHRDRFHEFLRLEGPISEDALKHCGERDCNQAIDQNGNLYRCLDCIDGSIMRCLACAKTMHSNLPFHRLTRWTGTHFQKCGTLELGLIYQLGHDGHSFCAKPSETSKLLVMHSAGACHIAVQYCECETAVDRTSQLLRSRLFPATLDRTQTVFTFGLLDFFHELNLQGKTPSYDYYTLLRQSDLLKLGPRISQLNNLNIAIRLWRHLQSLKRSGRAHDPQGASATKPGELMVECPACPHPDKNLPNDWRLATALAFLYTLYLAIDANFKLKGKDRGLDDIELAPGWGAFVEELAYQAHIGPYIDEPEINSCESEHDAVVRAAVRRTPGYSATGAGLVICSWHCLVRPNGAGDLQKGERYSNMDFILFSSFMALALLRVVITYDIACQWSRNYRRRLTKLPVALRPAEAIQIETAIPSWHINGHGKKCQDTDTMHTGYLNGVGRLCGDEVEQTWWMTNPLGVSVREMAPALRHETLNDQWKGFNLMRIVAFRERFSEKLKVAVKSEATHAAIFSKLSKDYAPAIRKEWEAMIKTFDKDKTKPSPYEEKTYAATYDEVRARLAADEKTRAEEGQVAEHKTSMPAFLAAGLDLEEKQRLLKGKVDALPNRITAKKDAEITERRTTLLRQILLWRKIQRAYMPDVNDFIDRTIGDTEKPEDIEVENINLWMPSALPEESRQSINRIANAETSLREAQAYDAISEICRIRRVITGVTTFKRFNLAGEGNAANTKMRTLYNGLQAKIDRAAKRYIETYKRLRELDPSGSWQKDLKELNPKEHIRGPNKDDGKSHGKHVPSWIWLTRKGAHKLSKEELEESVDSNLRAEWCRARARAMRWKEEVQLVQEEMRRTVVYLFWKAKWWEEKSGAKMSVPDDIQRGLAGYANRQAWYCRRLATSSLTCWKPILTELKLNTKWMDGWDIPEPPAKKGKKKASNRKGGAPTCDASDSESSDSELGLAFLTSRLPDDL